jgi:hypothetical protein
MSNSVLILGESGTGKSSSLRNLDSTTTYVLNVLDKPLPFKKSKKKYNTELKNYYATDDYLKIIEVIKGINQHRPDIKTLIIDDFQYIMASEFMNRALERGYDKFSEMANHVWTIIRTLIKTRDDLYTFVLCHSDIDSQGKSKIKTIGKLLDEKITLEGMFTNVLHTQILDGKYVFLTQGDAQHLAKSPAGMFSQAIIDNDLKLVLDCMYEYNNDEEE